MEPKKRGRPGSVSLGGEPSTSSASASLPSSNGGSHTKQPSQLSLPGDLPVLFSEDDDTPLGSSNPSNKSNSFRQAAPECLL